MTNNEMLKVFAELQETKRDIETKKVVLETRRDSLQKDLQSKLEELKKFGLNSVEEASEFLVKEEKRISTLITDYSQKLEGYKSVLVNNGEKV